MSSEIGIEEYRQDVLRVCSYHRTDFARAVVRTRPHKMQVIAPLLRNHFNNPSPFKHGPPFRLGVLDLLTPELLVIILLQLDVVSYLQFRRVNRHARVVATLLHEYKLVSAHGLEGLVALLRTKLAEFFTIKDLYRPLVTYSCKLCGGFGCFLFLPDCTRCCLPCLTEAPELRMTIVSSLVNQFLPVEGLTEYHQSQLGPVLHTVRGKYCLQHFRAVRLGEQLMPTRQVITILRSLDVPEKSIEKAVYRLRDWESNRFGSAAMYPWYNAQRGEAERGVNCKAIQFYIEENTPPHILRSACHRVHRDQIFSRASFLQHFKTCSHAQDLWARRDDGTPEKESWFISDGGYLRNEDEDEVVIVAARPSMY
ncbi:uncharacterized protein NECHADRAFT_37158 [Fusarium vanettenii 77-13-4]|uniref:F-box domain-containing protein n=1 Tax=Fusarium vanettenii (strain ATCC MYA-4622 / CBS 123669 / FGSC 9596 / NRRL 45880 / 77-13-4) TaxID=660122 RepID=C7ZFP1_FUSV7|nr:uncharacterized protein NECHADRAFT_37158 [Fusarium vanettenii 77-13-4]EEU37205.1 hypothetical protein NECHADRAFT_37158 [Fusarium vanettenii 77-13-4]